MSAVKKPLLHLVLSVLFHYWAEPVPYLKKKHPLLAGLTEFQIYQVLCRPPGCGPRLDRRARIQFRAGISKNVTSAGSQMTWEGGRAGISKNVTNAGSQLTFQMFRLCFGRGRGGRAGISKNVTNAGSQLTWEGGRAGISKNVTNAGSQLTFQMFRFDIFKHIITLEPEVLHR